MLARLVVAGFVCPPSLLQAFAAPAATQQNVGVGGGGLEGAEMFETTLAFFEEGFLLV